MKQLQQWVLALMLTVAASAAMATLPADVDTAITTAQTDILAMIGKGFAISGVVGALWVAYKYFKRILKGA
jgi:hypothetical protein